MLVKADLKVGHYYIPRNQSDAAQRNWIYCYEDTDRFRLVWRDGDDYPTSPIGEISDLSYVLQFEEVREVDVARKLL